MVTLYVSGRGDPRPQRLLGRGCSRWGDENAPKKGLQVTRPLCVHTHPLSPVLPAKHPNLATPRVVEVGAEWPVDCTMDGLFPASEAQVRLELAGRNLHLKVTHNKDSLLAKTNDKANMEEEGTQQVSCVVTLGNQSRSWREDVTFYSK